MYPVYIENLLVLYCAIQYNRYDAEMICIIKWVRLIIHFDLSWTNRQRNVECGRHIFKIIKQLLLLTKINYLVEEIIIIIHAKNSEILAKTRYQL